VYTTGVGAELWCAIQNVFELPISMSADRSHLSVPLEAVAVSMTPLERFEEYLQSKNLRNTEQRKFLIEQVFNRHSHFDADQLIEQLPSKGSANYVSRPTVYRTLREFVDAGLLNRFELDGRSVYEHDYGYPQHDHLYCTKCRKLIEFTSDEVVQIRDAVAKLHRFRAREHRFIIEGTCDECAKQLSKGRRQDRV
jgi:Fur family transcriptional regulator, ferric uptake regulator